MIIERHGFIDKNACKEEMLRMKESAMEQLEALDSEVLALQHAQASNETV